MRCVGIAKRVTNIIRKNCKMWNANRQPKHYLHCVWKIRTFAIRILVVGDALQFVILVIYEGKNGFPCTDKKKMIDEKKEWNSLSKYILLIPDTWMYVWNLNEAKKEDRNEFVGAHLIMLAGSLCVYDERWEWDWFLTMDGF